MEVAPSANDVAHNRYIDFTLHQPRGAGTPGNDGRTMDDLEQWNGTH